MNGYGVDCNPSLGLQYYKRAADKGYTSAQYNYGIHCIRGTYIVQDYKLGCEYLLKAANKGNVNACIEYARMCSNGLYYTINYHLGFVPDYLTLSDDVELGAWYIPIAEPMEFCDNCPEHWSVPANSSPGESETSEN